MGSFAVAGIQLDLEGDDNLARIGEEVAAAWKIAEAGFVGAELNR